MIRIILPAYNEEEALPPLLERIAALKAGPLPDLRVIVVDDGSADATAAVVRAFGASHPWVELVQHGTNQGLGQGMQTGFAAALEGADPADVIVALDADNTQPPELIPRMLEAINTGSDVVIASRYQPGAKVLGVPPLRRLFSWGMGLLFRVLKPIRRVRDYSSGFRAYRAETLQRAVSTYGDAFVTERGFACMLEILLQLARLGGVSFSEVPMVLRYDQKPTETKMSVVKTIRQTLDVAMRYPLK